MQSFLCRAARTQTGRRTPQSGCRRFVPRLEVLEDRTVPSTLTVTNLSDSGALGDGSLRGQIAAAAPGDTIQFAPNLSGTLGLGSDLGLDRNLTIVGNLDVVGNPLVTLNRFGAPYATDLVVNGGVTASVFGLAFTGGELHAVSNSGTLTLDHVFAHDNLVGVNEPDGLVAAHYGTVYNTGTLVVRDSLIANNLVETWQQGGGGGIYSTGTLTVANSTVASNQVLYGNDGGGIWIDAGTATIIGSTITGNQAPLGGGIGCQGLCALTISGCTVSGNSATSGGGIYAWHASQAAITGCTVSGNSARSEGGGIYFGPSQWTMADSTVANNQAGSGPSAGYGGGIYVDYRGAAVTVTNSTIAGNTALATSSSGGGGGIYLNSLVIYPVSTLTLLNCTVANNQSPNGVGGGLDNGPTPAQVSLTNTLFAGNTAAIGPDLTGRLLATSAYNLIGNGDGSSGLVNGTNGNQVGTTASPIDPLLGPLQDNGGPTPTMALRAGSPAIDAGSHTSPSVHDQRGYTRVVGAIDIGALEVQSATPPAAAVTLQLGAPATATAGQPVSMTVTLLDATGNVANRYTGTVHFFSSDASAVLPANFTFTSADAGTHTFSVTLKTAGTQSLTAADTETASLTATARGMIVTPAAAATLRLSAPAATTAGQAINVAATLFDTYGNVATGYTGTVRFTSSDASAALPPDYPFTSADAGRHSFSVTLKMAGTQSITAAAAVTPSLTATAGGIVVSPAAAAKFVLTAPASVIRGVAFSLTLMVQDAYGNTVTGYVDTVHFTSSDGTATLPANYTFTAADAGVHAFVNQTILRKRGTQTLTVTDLATSALTTTASINVT